WQTGEDFRRSVEGRQRSSSAPTSLRLSQWSVLILSLARLGCTLSLEERTSFSSYLNLAAEA
ncbi:hypothetical protein ACQ4N7_21330, partial [Nodosilinea sp. AN01ver1]|uniref:hypothetical protein n=1 Tax=Nodosilinea sp. AN01ver1 TaxID=3423362 RepID=UPI003D30F7C7